MAKKVPDSELQVEEYTFEGARYRKVMEVKEGRTSFYLDDTPVSAAAWNRAVNLHQPMRNKARHPVGFVRYLERRRRRRVVRLVDPRRDEVGADVGCEQGHLTTELARRGSRVVGLDLDPAVLAAARERSPGGGLLICGDVLSLPLTSGVLDYCLCAETLEHVEDVPQALLELRRVLKPGGRLVLAVPNEKWILLIKRTFRGLALTRFLGSLSPGLAMGHLRSFSAADLRSLVPAGFRRVRIFHDPPFFLNIYVMAEKE